MISGKLDLMGIEVDTNSTAILFLNRESGLFGMASLQEPEEVQETEEEKAE